MLTVFCRTRFVGFHRWKDAPESVGYLSHPHRHEFHVEVEVNVAHSDRAVEFITLKTQVEDLLSEWWNKQFEGSCESIAYSLSQKLKAYKYDVVKIEVSEDGENGGRFYGR